MSKQSKGVKYCVRCSKEHRNEHAVCPTCRWRERRDLDPVREVWGKLRRNARRRGVKFALSLEWFRSFLEGTEYMTKRGRKANDLTLDRKVNKLGYVDGNLQVITQRANSSKGSRDYESYEEGKARWGTPF